MSEVSGKEQRIRVYRYREGLGAILWRVEGFTDKEISELNSMDYRDMRDKLFEILNEKCKNLGTIWHNGYGVYNVYTSKSFPNCVFVETGSSSD